MFLRVLSFIQKNRGLVWSIPMGLEWYSVFRPETFGSSLFAWLANPEITKQIKRIADTKVGVLVMDFRFMVLMV